MPRFDHFDLLAPIYDRLFGYPSPEKLIEQVQAPPGGRLLDVGGGTGRVAQAFVRQASRVVVADLSRAMLRQAIRKDGLLPVQAYAEALPFPDGSFDRIVMVEALHHVADQRQAARELWRTLRPGGRIVVEEPDIDYLPVKAVAVFEKLILMRSRMVGPEQIARLFAFPGATSSSERDGYLARVIIRKGKQSP